MLFFTSRSTFANRARSLYVRRMPRCVNGGSRRSEATSANGLFRTVGAR